MQVKKKCNKYVCGLKKMSLYMCKPNTRIMLTKQEYIELYEKYEQGLCTEEELALLETYRDGFSFSDKNWDDSTMGDQELVKKNLRVKVESHIQKGRPISINHSLFKIAVTVILFLAAGLVIHDQVGNFSSEQRVDKNESSNGIKAGGFRATLMLDDGTTMDLEDLKTGDLVVNGDVLGSKEKNGQLAYRGTAENKAVKYHTIVTPRGGEFQVDLPDGSKVWLNAASSIRFPTNFTGDQRQVKISGEVYFQVTKDRDRPFIVDVGDQLITVLGTQFNVNAYKDEQSVQTSLVEGKVAIQSIHDNLVLSPGQRANYNKKSAKMTTDTFNVSDVLAWQRGEFVFNAESIQSIMRKIERWYDVEIVYDNSDNITEKVFSGSISRFEQVDEVLNMLALTGTVSFETKGRRIHVLN